MFRDGKVCSRSFILVILLALPMLAGGPALAATGKIELVSRALRGTPPDTAGSWSVEPRMSADGRYVVFFSDARNLVPGQVTLSPLGNLFLHDRVTGKTVLVSHAAGSANITGDLNSASAIISPDGNWIVFVSRARNLVRGLQDSPPVYQLYLFERATGRITLLSRRAADGKPGNDSSGSPSMSADGRFIAFRSSATDLLPQPISAGTGTNIFLLDRVTGAIVLVSRSASSPNQAGNDESVQPVLSADGRWVAYSSRATDLVAGQSDPGRDFDVFLFDRLTGTNTLVSHSPGSALSATNGAVPYPGLGLSANGQFLAYTSSAHDLAAGVSDPFGNPDVFLYDRLTNTSVLVSRSTASPNDPDPEGARNPILSADGRTVAYIQGYQDAPRSQAFLFDRLTRASTLVTRRAASPSGPSNGATANLVLSRDGRTLLFTSTATNLMAGQSDRPDTYDVFRYDLSTGTTALVSHAAGFPKRAGDNNPYPSEIDASADGSWIAYSSYAANLDVSKRDSASTKDIFLYARATDASRTVTLHPPGLASRTPDNTSFAPSLSGDGRYVAFLSAATDLIPGQVDRGATYDVFLYDRLTRETVLVSRANASPRTAANGPSTFALISRDGSSVLFASQATNLIPRQSGPAGKTQIFLFDRRTAKTTLVSRSSASLTRGGNQDSFPGGLSVDGAIAVFNSYSSDLVAGQQDRNQTLDVFSYDRRTGTVTLVSHVPGSPVKTGNSTSFFSSMSPEGAWIGLVSYAWDLTPGVPPPATPEPEDQIANAYLFPRGAGDGILLGRNVGGYRIQGLGRQPQISAGGRYVAFGSYDLSRDNSGLPVFTNPKLVLLDRSSGLLTPITPVSRAAGSFYRLAGLSDDGRYVLFASDAPDVVPGQDDSNEKPDLFLFDRVSGETRLVSHLPGFPNRASGVYEDGSYPPGRLSADGRRAVFQSDSPDLLQEPPLVPELYGILNVFLYDAASEEVTLVSHAPGSPARAADVGASSPVISANGNFIAFSSRSSNLVTGDFNSWDDVFLYALDPGL